MGKLRVLSGKEVCGILSRHSFVRIRQRGSHIVMQKIVKDSTITVPVPDHPERKRGPLLGIIRQSRLPRREFESR